MIVPVTKKPFFLKSLLMDPNFILSIHLERSLSQFSKDIQGSVLDFGCGTKPWERIFPLARSYTGVDLLVWGSEATENTNPKVDVFYNGEILPFEDGRFDAVVAFEVFEHLTNPTKSLDEINRVLKNGGLLLTSTPFLFGEHGMPHDYFRYTSSGMKHLLASAGFVQLKFSKSSSFLATLLQTHVLFTESLSKGFPFPIGNILRVTTRVFFGLLCLPIFSLSRPKLQGSHYLNLVTLSKKECQVS